MSAGGHARARRRGRELSGASLAARRSATLAQVSVPAEIPGIGSTSLKPKVSPTFDPLRAGIGPEEYFVMSRIDGLTSLRDIIVTTGLPVSHAISIVSRLRSLGALLLPGEVPAPPAAQPGAPSSSASAAGSGRVTAPTPSRAEARSAAGEAAARAGQGRDDGDGRPAGDGVARGAKVVLLPLDVSLPAPTPVELAVLSADIDVADADRRAVLAMARRIGSDPWTVLGVAKGTDLSELKKIYFRLSKEVHPDRYYGKRLGPMAEVLSAVFESVRRAYAMLTDAKKQRERGPASASSPQAPADYAVELFERGCAAEVGGDLPGALQLFAASLRVDPQLKVYRRAASCALSAREAKLALEYAKKASALAPDDPSCARLLARAYRAGDELVAAEEVLVLALALPSDNDVLMAELRADLAVVRKQLTQA